MKIFFLEEPISNIHFVWQDLQEDLSSYWILPSSLVSLDIEVKVLLADICSLLNPTDYLKAVENYEEIESYLLNQVSLTGFFLFDQNECFLPAAWFLSRTMIIHENTLKNLLFPFEIIPLFL